MGIIAWIRKQLKKSDDWIEAKKERKTKTFKDYRMDVKEMMCPSCGHHKAWSKYPNYKCTRCKHRWKQ